MKKCPYCAEEIQDEAVKCRYCHSTVIHEEQKQTSKKNTYVPQLPLDFSEAVGACLGKYFDFSGRARASEYWYFFLFCFLVNIAASILDVILFDFSFEENGTLFLIFSLILFIPQISAAARRLHDTNKSGWRQLWILTIIGAFFVLYWLIIKGNTDANSYDSINEL